MDFYIFTSFALLAIGILGILASRNPLILFLSIEMMLNSANLLFVFFARLWGNQVGQLWVFFVLVVAAAEAAIGIAIIIRLFRSKKEADIDQYDSLRG